MIEGVYSGLSLSMNVVNSFAAITATASNYTVSEVAQYSIGYTLPFAVNSSKSYKLKVVFPSEYRVLSCGACNSFGEIAITSNSGTLTIDQVQNPFKTVVTSEINF